jgi:hypothetical protein
MDHIEIELKQSLKSWADQQPLPSGGRSQLISAAASIRDERGKNTPQNLTQKPVDLISWAMVYCIDRQFATGRLVS